MDPYVSNKKPKHIHAVFTDPSARGVAVFHKTTGELVTMLSRGQKMSMCLSRTTKCVVWIPNIELGEAPNGK